MICPKCGEVNSSNFLFCGMCGTILEPARRATAAVTPPPPAPPVAAEPVRVVIQPAPPPPAATNAPPKTAPVEAYSPIGGPSLLGLDQGNSVDDFRDRAFSGLASYGKPDKPKSAGKEILLTVVLVAALAGAGWWAYKNYIGVTSTHKAAATVPAGDTVDVPSETPPSKPAEQPEVKTTPPASATPAEEASSSPPAKAPVENPPAATSEEAAAPATKSNPKPATPAPTPARHEVSATRMPSAKPAPAPVDNGDALFKRGQGYLYGRKGAEDCGNALKYLKMAADKQHAKARSMMGTMYATGHCVPRDLPSSYRWFALALRVDPNNSILEKDLSAIWNQMTPPERQMATRSQ